MYNAPPIPATSALIIKANNFNFEVLKPALLTGLVLSFAHTVGEFGVILMIGGNIPGETQVLSIALYDYVETLRFDEAHRLAAGLVVFSLLLLFALYRGTGETPWRLRA